MKTYFTFCLLFFGVFLLLPNLAQAEQSSLPNCAQSCLNSTVSCDPTTDLSCICSDATSLNSVRDCFYSSCLPRDAFAAVNLTATACEEPLRTKAATYRYLNLVFFCLSTLAIAGRVIAHFSVGRLQWLEDSNMAFVLALNCALFAVTFKMSFTGLGHDMWTLQSNAITSTLLLFWISEVVYFSTLGFVKIAFLLFFLQIFPQKNFRRVVWGFITINIAATFSFALAAICACLPVSYFWTQWDGLHHGHCVNNNALAFSHAALSILLDFVTLSLPISQIWNLHLSLNKKIGVLLMFSVGIFVTIVSIIRLRSLVHFANTSNMTWDYLEASLWSVIEVDVGIICACMPSIRLGLARLFPRLLGSSHQASKPTNGVRTGDGPGLNANSIAVRTDFRVSHTRKPLMNDDRSFVQLVDIDADAKSTETK